LNQTGKYWGGRYLEALEANPVAFPLLSQHPLVFAAGITIWIILFLVLIILLPMRPAMILSITITFGHLWGAGGWVMNCTVMTGCPYTMFYGHWICLTLILVAAILIVVACEKLHFVK
jgi:hypothetical protein